MTPFELVGDLTEVETIATGRGIRDCLGSGGCMAEAVGGK